MSQHGRLLNIRYRNSSNLSISLTSCFYISNNLRHRVCWWDWYHHVTRSGNKWPSNTSLSLFLPDSLNISPKYFETLHIMSFHVFMYFGIDTKWYLHFEWFSVFVSFISLPLIVCLVAQSLEYPRWTFAKIKIWWPPRQNQETIAFARCFSIYSIF